MSPESQEVFVGPSSFSRRVFGHFLRVRVLYRPRIVLEEKSTPTDLQFTRTPLPRTRLRRTAVPAARPVKRTNRETVFGRCSSTACERFSETFARFRLRTP